MWNCVDDKNDNEEGRAPLEYLPRGPRVSSYATAHGPQVVLGKGPGGGRNDRRRIFTHTNAEKLTRWKAMNNFFKFELLQWDLWPFWTLGVFKPTNSYGPAFGMLIFAVLLSVLKCFWCLCSFSFLCRRALFVSLVLYVLSSFQCHTVHAICNLLNQKKCSIDWCIDRSSL